MSCSISRTDEDVLVGQLRALLQDANVNCPVNRELLLVFLRVRKLDVNRAVRLVKNYLKLLKNSPELTGDLRLPSLRNALEQDVVFTSRSRDKHGRRLFISLLGQWKTDRCSLGEMFRLHVYCLQRMASQVETQKKGIVVLVDFDGLGLSHVRHFTPAVAKSVALIFQDSFPIRFQAIHILNEPIIFKMVVSIIWPFLSDKMKSRIYFHGRNVGTLHEHVAADLLPVEYAGSRGSLRQMAFLDVLPKNQENLFDLMHK